MVGRKENAVRDKSFDFAIRIVKLYQQLSNQNLEYVLSKQLLKSGTSIGANTEEADSAISMADFSNKISIAYKEARETHYWLRILQSTGYIDKTEFDSLIEDCDELCKLLFSILKTTRIGKEK